MINKKKKNRILLIVKLSKVITTGFYSMNQQVISNRRLQNDFDLKTLPLFAVDRKESKVLNFLSVLFCTILNSAKLLLIILSFKPRLVYFTISPVNAFMRDLIYVSILKLFKITILYHLHGKGINATAKKSRLKYLLYGWAYKDAYVICLSDLLSDDITEIYDGNPFIVYNGVQPIINNSKVKKKRAKVRILCLSNLIETKGIYDFIDALKILKSKHIDFEAVMVGASVDITVRELDKIIKKHQLKSVLKILGPKYNEDKYQEFLLADIFAYPTRQDAFPLVILEAMNFGLPIISTKEGAIPEIIEDGITGFIIEKGDSKDLAAKLEILIENESLRKLYGDAAKEKFLQKYTDECFQKNMKQVFLQAIEIMDKI